MLLALGVGIALPAIPVLARSFDVGFGLASFVITSVFDWRHRWHHSDRLDDRPIRIGGPLFTAAVALLVAQAHTLPELLFYRFVDGWAAPGQRGRLVSWTYGMDNIERLTGPLLGGFLAASLGPRSPFVAYAVLALVALLPTVALAADVPRRVASANPPGSDSGPLTLLQIILPRLPFFGVALFSAVARGPIFADMLHLYAAFTYNLDASGFGVLATAASCISLPVSFLAGWMLDRFGRKATMVPGFTGVSVMMLLVAVMAILNLSLVWYVASFLTGVAAQSLTGGSVQTIGADVAPSQARGLFLGLWRCTGQIGQTVSPVVFALLASTTGYGSSFIFIAVA